MTCIHSLSVIKLPFLQYAMSTLLTQYLPHPNLAEIGERKLKLCFCLLYIFRTLVLTSQSFVIFLPKACVFSIRYNVLIIASGI